MTLSGIIKGIYRTVGEFGKKKKKKTIAGFSNTIFEAPPHLLNSYVHISVEPPTRTENVRLMSKTITKGHVSLR